MWTWSQKSVVSQLLSDIKSVFKYSFQVWTKTLSDIQFVTLLTAIRYWLYGMYHLQEGRNQLWCIRSSHQRGSMKNGVLRNFAKFIGKHLCQIQSLRPATLLKKKFWHRCFPVNFAKSLRTPFLQNSSGRLLLYKKRSFMTGFKQAFGFEMCYII